LFINAGSTPFHYKNARKNLGRKGTDADASVSVDPNEMAELQAPMGDLEQYPCALTHEHCSNPLLEGAIHGIGDSTKTDRALGACPGIVL